MIGFLKALIPVAKVAGKLLGVQDTADALGISKRFLYELIKKKKIKSHKIGGRRLIPEDELENIKKKTARYEEQTITKIEVNFGKVSCGFFINWNR